jgi:hypothetical protein
MLRRTMVAMSAIAALAAATVSTEASARGGFGGFHGGGFHGGGFRGGGWGARGLGLGIGLLGAASLYGAYDYYDGYYGVPYYDDYGALSSYCRPTTVWTPFGWVAQTTCY